MTRVMNDTAVARQLHPGSGRRKGSPTPKGRQVDPDAFNEIRKLLATRERRRDLLIEHLHLIQDHYGCLKAAHLAALAHEMKLALAEVYEVATFYAHFDVVKEGESAPPPVTVRVCDSLTCELLGAAKLQSEIAAAAGKEVRVIRAHCMGLCDQAPAVAVGHHHFGGATAAAALAAAKDDHGTETLLHGFETLGAYRADGGYRLLEECRAGKRSPEDLIALLEGSGLRGLGGAGFPS